MRAPLKPSVLKPLRWLLGFGLIAAILLTSDWDTFVSALGDASWTLAVPAIAGLVIANLVPAGTWKLLLQRLSGIRISWPLAARAYYASRALGSFTPASIGGDVYRYYLLKDENNLWASVAIPILAQRLLNYTALLILAGVAVLLLPTSASTRMVIGLSEFTFLGVVILSWVAFKKWNLNIRRFLPQQIKKMAQRLAITHYSGFLGTLKDGLLQSFLFHLVAIALSYLLVLSLGLDGPFLATLAVLTLARTAMHLPVSPSGFGLQEGALALLFPHIGLASEAGLAVSVLNRLSLLITIAIGALCLGFGKTGARDEKARSVVDRTEVAMPTRPPESALGSTHHLERLEQGESSGGHAEEKL